MKTAQYILDKKSHNIWSVHPSDSVFDAIQMMANEDVGALIVIEDDALVGILSERDYARNVVLKGKTSPKTKVREIMITRVVCARPEQTVEQCMAVMTKKRVRHLPVLHEKKVVGIISLGDVATTIIEDKEHDIEELEHYIHTA